MKFPFLLTFLFFSTISQAFKLSPMSLELNKENNFKSVLKISNESNSPIAVEVSMAHRQMDEQGQEKHPDANNLFSVYPEQVILRPKESKAVRLRWIGDKKLITEKSFRIIAEQLPINLSGEREAGIKMLMRYMGSIYVVPQKGKSSIKTSIISKEKTELKFKISNNGNIHKIIEDINLEITTKEKIHSIDRSLLKHIIGENILAKSKRIFKIKTKLKNKIEKVTIEVK